jgi:hypothetical protein
MSLRTAACQISKLAHKAFSTPCVLIAPDGTRYDTDTESNSLTCQLLSGRVSQSPDSGEEMVVFRPVATFYRGLLPRIPQDGEKWSLEAPLDPESPTVTTLMAFDGSKAIEGGRSLATIRIYLSQVAQS